MAKRALPIVGSAGQTRSQHTTVCKKRLVADVVCFKLSEIRFGSAVRNGREAKKTDGIKRAIELLSMWVGGIPYIGHRAASFLERLNCTDTSYRMMVNLAHPHS
jgi:hypothetical protein